MRLKTGNRHGFEYAYLSRVDYNPSHGLVLHFAAAKVTISGRCLEPLYQAALTQRLEWVREPDAPYEPESSACEPWITSIELTMER